MTNTEKIARSLSRKTKRGSTPTKLALKVTEPGQAATMNIVPNMTGKGLGPGTAAKYFLLLCDVFSKFAALFPMKDKTPSSVFTAITTWQTIYRTAEAEIHPGFLSSIRSDADPVFMSEELHNACTNRGTYSCVSATPRDERTHQENLANNQRNCLQYDGPCTRW